MTKYKELANRIGALVDEKNKAYGNSFDQAGEFLRLLYPDGIAPEKYTDMLCIIRIFDKLKRVATKKDAFGESPYQDIVGYGLLGLDKDNRAQEKAKILSVISKQVEAEAKQEEIAAFEETDIEEVMDDDTEEEEEVNSDEEPAFLKLDPGQPAILQDSSSKEVNEKVDSTEPEELVSVNCVLCNEFVANVSADFAEKQKLFAHEECYNKTQQK